MLNCGVLRTALDGETLDAEQKRLSMTGGICLFPRVSAPTIFKVFLCLPAGRASVSAGSSGFGFAFVFCFFVLSFRL